MYYFLKTREKEVIGAAQWHFPHTQEDFSTSTLLMEVLGEKKFAYYVLKFY